MCIVHFFISFPTDDILLSCSQDCCKAFVEELKVKWRRKNSSDSWIRSCECRLLRGTFKGNHAIAELIAKAEDAKKSPLPLTSTKKAKMRRKWRRWRSVVPLLFSVSSSCVTSQRLALQALKRCACAARAWSRMGWSLKIKVIVDVVGENVAGRRWQFKIVCASKSQCCSTFLGHHNYCLDQLSFSRGKVINRQLNFHNALPSASLNANSSKGCFLLFTK